MTKRTLVFILATVLALGGCMAAPKSKEAAPQQQDVLIFPPPPDEPRFIYENTLMSSADVIPDTEDDILRRMLTGEQRTGQGLAKPYGVAVHRGRVFVGDSVARVVVVFDIPGQRFFKIGEEEPGILGMPLGLDVDKQGNLYVVDGTAKQVMVYDRDGKFLRSIVKPGQLNRPVGIAVNAGGTRAYVVDAGGISSHEHRVRVYDAQSGEHLFDFGKRGTEPGEFNLPRDIAIAPDGSLYVVDGANFRVQKFSADGKFISTFGSIGRQSGQFSRPKEVAVDAAGNVYITDASFGNFQIFNADGQLLLAVGGRSERNGPALFMLPAGIAVDEDGRVYMADQYFRKVDIFRPAALAADDGFVKKALTTGKPAKAVPAVAQVVPPAATTAIAPVVAAAIVATPVVTLPALKPVETTTSAGPGPEVLKATQNWAAAWSAKNSDEYLTFYAAEFKTPGGISRSAWEAQRKQRIAKPASIQVEVQDPKVKVVDDNHVNVSFKQSYRTDTRGEISVKTIEWEKSDGRWQIMKEH